MRLYRIVRESCYNGGGPTEVQGTKVLYCGYDRMEALRIFHANRPEDQGHDVPGHHFTRTKATGRDVGCRVT